MVGRQSSQEKKDSYRKGGVKGRILRFGKEGFYTQMERSQDWIAIYESLSTMTRTEILKRGFDDTMGEI